MNRRPGIALVLCAPSGTGKTTLSRRLMAEFSPFSFSVSCTTRPPRPGEVHGKDYTFLGKEEFLALREQGHFAEWAEVHGNFYGTPLDATRKLLAASYDVLFDIDVQGAAQLKQTLPGAAFVFIMPPSLAELERRLRSRGTDSEETITRRLNAAEEELAQAHWFDAWIINEDLEQAYADLVAFYRAATLRPSLQPDFVRELLHHGVYPHEGGREKDGNLCAPENRPQEDRPQEDRAQKDRE